MNRTVVRSKIDGDGVLRMTLPFGMADAEQKVQVTVEPVVPEKQLTEEEWTTWVNSMAGRINDPTFERPRRANSRRVRKAVTHPLEAVP